MCIVELGHLLQKSMVLSARSNLADLINFTVERLPLLHHFPTCKAASHSTHSTLEVLNLMKRKHVFPPPKNPSVFNCKSFLSIKTGVGRREKRIKDRIRGFFRSVFCYRPNAVSPCFRNEEVNVEHRQ